MIALSFVALTVGIFVLMTWLYKRSGISFLFPILTSTIVLIVLLVVFDVPYDQYMKGGFFINWLLGPAVVAMAYPLYTQWETIMKNRKIILSCVSIAMVMGMISVLLLAWIAQLTTEVKLSYLPKSITSPVALQISDMIGGIPQFTVFFVIVAGIIGAILGPMCYRIFKIDTPVSRGVAMGSASHGIGVSKLTEYGERTLSIGSVSMTLSAILGAVLCPIVAWLLF